MDVKYEIAELTKYEFWVFALRCAADEWLKEHPNDPNAPTVRLALQNTMTGVPQND